ncbi:FG-GAP repeat protein [Hydrogenophaga crocea]|uniref:Integrin n=1 Tax=Hydrogenophaga crocea TaxID=2716225 RepID=A0A6G8IMZ0_9BURK|nr:FG-GAP repeat protein [Hydrogenophaga crocea]QIM54554.1 integrin [Hydrogenophaga crocea]
MNLSGMFWCAALTTAVAVGLSACGGGGGGGFEGPDLGPPPGKPVLALGLQGIKGLHFSWTAVSGEPRYTLLESPRGDGQYTALASNLATDTTQHDRLVFLPTHINARYILRACNRGGCTDSVPVAASDSLNTAIGYVKASNTAANQVFGFSVALSADGGTLAVGAPYESDSGSGINQPNHDSNAPFSGAVYVYVRDGTAWTQQAYVKAAVTEAFDLFGTSVALSGDGSRLAVGSVGESSSRLGINQTDTESGTRNSGAVYVFSRSAGAWTQDAFIKTYNNETGNAFGSSVALSADGNTLAAGAPGESSNHAGIFDAHLGPDPNLGAPQSGAVYTFAYLDSHWDPALYIKASNTGANDRFGTSVALSADGLGLAVGAPGEDSGASGINGTQADESALDSGAVYLFGDGGTNPSGSPLGTVQTAYIKASNAHTANTFGTSVSLSLDGTALAVGAPGESSNVPNSGAAYVFVRAANAWSQVALVKASNAGDSDFFGVAVALSADGRTLAVGARGEDSDALGLADPAVDNDNAPGTGAVYVFERDGVAWRERAQVKPSNAIENGGRFGNSLALAQNSEGLLTLAVGAIGDSSSATGVGGDQSLSDAPNSGAVYLY